MEISFKRASYSDSSKPPIVGNSKANKDVIAVSNTGSISAEETRKRVQGFFRENSASPSPNQHKQCCAHNTLNNDVFIISGDSTRSAKKITKQSCDNLCPKDEQKHNLTQILLQPKKSKKQAAFYFDTTSMQGKKLSVVDIDKSNKGRVKVTIKALDVMA